MKRKAFQDTANFNTVTRGGAKRRGTKSHSPLRRRDSFSQVQKTGKGILERPYLLQ